MEGEFVDTVIGIPDSRSEILTLRAARRGNQAEPSSFIRPDHEPGSPNAMSTELGLRNVSFVVDDLRRMSTAWLRTAMASSAASVSTRTSGAWRTCAGRRGIIAALAPAHRLTARVEVTGRRNLIRSPGLGRAGAPAR